MYNCKCSVYASPLHTAEIEVTIYREDFYFVFQFHGSALHGDRCTAGCEAHTNSADILICLLTDNVRNEVVTIHRSQEVVKMLSLYTVKKHRYKNPSCTYSTPDTNFHWMEQDFVG
jgi:hypothetical protein